MNPDLSELDPNDTPHPTDAPPPEAADPAEAADLEETVPAPAEGTAGVPR